MPSNRPAPLQCSICGAPLKAGDTVGELIIPDGTERMFLCQVCWNLELALQRVAKRKGYNFG